VARGQLLQAQARLGHARSWVCVGSQLDLQERANIRPDTAAKPGVVIEDAIKTLQGR
jgi:hypothetical protein